MYFGICHRKSRKGKTASRLFQAMRHFWATIDFGTVKNMIETGTDPDTVMDAGGWTPLLCACYVGHLPAVRYLLTEARKRATYNQSLENDYMGPNGDDREMTPLFMAIQGGNREVAKFLIEDAAREHINSNVIENTMRDVSHMLIPNTKRVQFIECLMSLLEAGHIAAETRLMGGNTILHAIAFHMYRSNNDMYSIQKTISLFSSSPNGEKLLKDVLKINALGIPQIPEILSSMHIAAKTLIHDHGLDINTLNNACKSPLSIAFEENNGFAAGLFLGQPSLRKINVYAQRGMNCQGDVAVGEVIPFWIRVVAKAFELNRGIYSVKFKTYQPCLVTFEHRLMFSKAATNSPYTCIPFSDKQKSAVLYMFTHHGKGILGKKKGVGTRIIRDVLTVGMRGLRVCKLVHDPDHNISWETNF